MSKYSKNSGCTDLTSVYIEDIDKWAEIEFADKKANPLYYAKNLYLNGELVTDAELRFAKKIGSYAFCGCSGLTSVTIGIFVTSVGKYAFADCDGLTSVYITDIDKWAEIEFDVFESNPLYYAKNLYLNGELVTDARLGTATKIGDYAFHNYTRLKSIEIPDSVTIYGVNPRGMISIKAPNSITSIGEGAFYGCSGLSSVIIGNSVTSIEKQAFCNCSGLTSIEIPNSVTSIGGYAFYGCRLKLVKLNWNKPVAITSNTFSDYSAIIDFPLSSIAIYSSVDPWNKFRINTIKSMESNLITLKYEITDYNEVIQKFNETGLVCNGKYYKADANGIATVDDLKPDNSYTVFGYVKYDGEYFVSKSGVSNKTKPVSSAISASQTAKSQTTITLKVNDISDKSLSFEEIGVKWGSKYYKANSEGIVKIEHLCPNTSGIVYGYAKYGGEYYVSKEGTSVSTKPINSELAFSDIMANKAFVRGVYDIGDAHVYKTTFELKIPTEKGSSWTEEEIEYKNDKFTLMGLDPDTEYGVCYTVYYHYGENDEYSGSEYDKQYFTTAELKMTTLLPKNVSSTTSIVAAEANISDDETGAGFEWRKYDAPESLPSSRGKAIVFDGKMEGKINNLQPVYYNVRPYYESASGNMYYGDWMTFDPTDFSYFEPTVHTYDFPEEPSSNSVEVRGYVMQGTDDVMEQGFEYWKTGDSSQRKMASNGEVMRVKATGQLMIATLKDLDYESHYVVRAYVITAGGTVYGEERTFATPADPTSGIIEVKENESVSRSLKGIYTMDGRKIERITTPGIYIRNGRKILVRQDQLPLE